MLKGGSRNPSSLKKDKDGTGEKQDITSISLPIKQV